MIIFLNSVHFLVLYYFWPTDHYFQQIPMSTRKKFSPEDIVAYYDQTEVHYRMFWKLEKSMGLHYGVWGPKTRTLADAIINTNAELARLGNMGSDQRILDAGCGVGGSAQYLARTYGCRVHGITLSAKQVHSAREYAQKNQLDTLLSFSAESYDDTSFAKGAFDAAWAIESMQTAGDKSHFFREMNRVIRRGGQLFIGDMFKSYGYELRQYPRMEKLLHGWAIGDMLSLDELLDLAGEYRFKLVKKKKVTAEVFPSVKRIYWAALAGRIGTRWYNLFHNGSYFGRIHYTTGINQYHTYKKGLWDYQLICLQKQ